MCLIMTFLIVVGCSGPEEADDSMGSTESQSPTSTWAATTTVEPDASRFAAASVSPTAFETQPSSIVEPTDTAIPTIESTPTEVEPTATTPPTAPPTPTEVATLSPEYLNPVDAIQSALADEGQSAQGAYAKTLYSQVFGIRALYHLATVDIGQFNADTTQFYEWLRLYVRFGSSQELINAVGLQYEAAVFQPETEIAQRLRQLESGLDPTLPIFGPEVYLSYLVLPYLAASSGKMAPELMQGLLFNFSEKIQEYNAANLASPGSFDGLAAYLRSIDYGRGLFFDVP
jgi:hypothetical protein